MSLEERKMLMHIDGLDIFLEYGTPVVATRTGDGHEIKFRVEAIGRGGVQLMMSSSRSNAMEIRPMCANTIEIYPVDPFADAQEKYPHLFPKKGGSGGKEGAGKP